MSFKRLAIYCGSATPADPVYVEIAKEVGTELARRGITVVYGGGKVGLMGMIADSALAAGGEVIAEASLVDRSAGDANLGVPFFPLVSLNFPVYDADDLPPELAAIPATKPGSRA